MTKTSADLYAYLEGLGLTYTHHDHAPVFTVEESQALRDGISGGHTKNLFLKDKKGRHFLLTVGEDAEINLKMIHTRIGAQGRVSFGKAEQLMDYLGVVPGAVSAFGILNDETQKVTLIFDAALMAHDIINCHPLRNDATTSISRDHLCEFVHSLGRDVHIEALSAPFEDAG